VHVTPFVFLQTPRPSHALGAVHDPSACPAATFVQVPTLPARLQASHAPVHADWQHTPSTHWPDAHSVPSVPHACPSFSLHAPAPLHTFVPLHAGDPFGSSLPAAT
jgi:hypothetical protein